MESGGGRTEGRRSTPKRGRGMGPGCGPPAAEAASCELAVGAEAEGRLCGQEGPVEEVNGGGDEAMAGRKVGVAVDVEVVTPRAGGSEASAVRAAPANVHVVHVARARLAKP